MAELFSFQSPQQVAHTSVPTINVAPNLQASRAFESLGNLVSTAQQAQAQGIERERALFQTQQQVDAATTTADAKLRTKEVESEAYMFTQKTTDLKMNFDVAFANANGNTELRNTLVESYLQDMGGLFNGLEDDTRIKVHKAYNTSITQAVGAHAEKAVTLRLKTQNELEAQQVVNQARIFDETVAGLQRDFDVAMAGAGDNLEARQEAFFSYTNEMNALYSGVSDEVKNKVQDSFQSSLTSAYKAHAKDEFVIQKSRFDNRVSQSLPSFLAQAPEAQATTYNALMAEAVELGIDKKTFGQDMVDRVAKYAIATADIEALTQNFDYNEVDKINASIEAIRAADPKTSTHVDKALQDVQTGIKDHIDTAVRSSMNLALQELNFPEFERLAGLALENTAISQADFSLKYQSFGNKLASSDKMAKTYANEVFTTTGGRTAISAFSNPKAKKAFTALVEKSLVEQLNSGQFDYDNLRYHANNNPTIYGKVFKEALGTTVGAIIHAAETPAKTPEELAARQGEVINRVGALNRMMRASNGHADKSLLLQVEVAKMLSASNHINNIPDALINLRSSGEYKALSTSSNLYTKLKDEVSSDQLSAAHRSLSVLVNSSQMEDSAALEAVIATYSYQSFDDVDFELSGGVVDALTGAGATTNSIENLQSTLMDEGILPEEVSNKLSTVIEGENPKVRMLHGSLYFTNDDGDTSTIIMDEKRLQALTGEMNKRYQDTEVPVGVGIIVDDVATGLSKVLNEAWESATQRTAGLTAPIVYGVDRVIPDLGAVVDHMATNTTNINELIGDLYAGQMTEDEAIAKWRAKGEKADAALMKAFGEDHKASYESYKRKMEEFSMTLPTLPVSKKTQAILGMFQATVDFAMPKAEASVTPDFDGETPPDVFENPPMMPDGTTPLITPLEKKEEAVVRTELPAESQFLDLAKQRETSGQGKEGVTHKGAEGGDSDTTQYGVRIADYPKKEGETDRQHALRVFRDHFQKPIASLGVKGIEPQKLALMAWNVGMESKALQGLKGLDLNIQQDRRKAFLKINGPITSSGKWMTGLINARAKDWNMVAAEVSPSKVITGYEVWKRESDSRTYRTYHYTDGTERTLYTTKGKHSQSKIEYNKLYTIK